MMKKLLPFGAAAFGLIISAQANAAAVAIVGNSNPLSPVECSALDNNITVQLSKGVIGAYNCDNLSFIAATCHTAGSNKTQTLECLYDDSDQPLTGYNGCGAPSGDADNPTMQQFTGRLAYNGGSDGGRVTVAPLAGNDCDAAGIVTVTPDDYLDSGVSTSQAAP